MGYQDFEIMIMILITKYIHIMYVLSICTVGGPTTMHVPTHCSNKCWPCVVLAYSWLASIHASLVPRFLPFVTYCTQCSMLNSEEKPGNEARYCSMLHEVGVPSILASRCLYIILGITFSAVWHVWHEPSTPFFFLPVPKFYPHSEEKPTDTPQVEW